MNFLVNSQLARGATAGLVAAILFLLILGALP